MRRLTLDLTIPVIVAATIVAFAAGSSSVAGVIQAGRAARWVALLALFAAAAGWVGRPVARLRLTVAVSALAFLSVAVESAVWSVDPRLTIERAATLVLLFATAAAFALACAANERRSRLVLWGIVAGALVVTALGLDHARRRPPRRGAGRNGRRSGPISRIRAEPGHGLAVAGALPAHLRVACVPGSQPAASSGRARCGRCLRCVHRRIGIARCHRRRLRRRLGRRRARPRADPRASAGGAARRCLARRDDRRRARSDLERKRRTAEERLRRRRRLRSSQDRDT